MPSEYLGNTNMELIATEGDKVFKIYDHLNQVHIYIRLEDAEMVADQIKSFAAHVRKSQGQRAYEKVFPDGDWESLSDQEKRKWHSIFE